MLQSFASKLGHSVKWFSDNQAVVRIVQVGSGKLYLLEGILPIFELFFQHNIKLELEWVPRSANELANYMNRVRDFDDWMVSPSLFQYCDQTWGLHMLANEHNSQTAHFQLFLVPWI